jgi:hypothetical protein
MTRRIVTVCLTIGILLCAGCERKSESTVRPPAVAGQFYPQEVRVLKKMVGGFLGAVPEQKPDGRLVAIISPHAGYVYSGQTAAHAFALLKSRNYNTVILIGPSHHVRLNKAVIYPSGAWRTPLGALKIDGNIVDKLLACPDIISDIEPFAPEHSLEVLLPFLQTVWHTGNFKIVPILINYPDNKLCSSLAQAIAQVMGDRQDILIVASTDMSHYHPDTRARQMDKLTINIMEKYDTDGLITYLSRGEAELCGSAAVITTMLASRQLGADKITCLHYANSGDTTGDKSSVVGYGAFAITSQTKKKPPVKGETGMLNQKQRELLLRIARETISNYLKSGKKPDFEITDPTLLEDRGAFVTLHKSGMLRGCIGSILPREPLWQAVRNMAIESAFRDTRFQPLDASELDKIDIEISVLSVPKKVKSADEIRPGEHGVIVNCYGRSGVFLPQVATETGWSKEEFLRHLCADKAGLSPDAWKDAQTDLFVFTAEVFGE